LSHSCSPLDDRQRVLHASVGDNTNVTLLDIDVASVEKRLWNRGARTRPWR
jgi:hypothetical protein